MKLNSSPTAAAATEIQSAVVEKGIEVMGKMVDKQLQIVDEAQEKAKNFLKKKVGRSKTPSEIKLNACLSLLSRVMHSNQNLCVSEEKNAGVDLFY